MNATNRFSNMKTWMSGLPGQLRLNELMLCGSHDTCTEGIASGSYSRTQDQTLAEQLAMGVRFLDLRVGSDANIYHSSDPVGMSLTQAFTTISQFLQQPASSRETLVVSIKQEGDSQGGFSAKVDQWVRNSGLNWYLENEIPELDAVRGKLVLVRRYSVPHVAMPQGTQRAHGIDLSMWGPVHNNDSFEHRLGEVTISVQDEYSRSEARTKEGDVRGLLANMARLETKNWYLNFTSAAKGMEPYTIAWGAGSGGVNAWLEEFLPGAAHLHGVFMVDFVRPPLARAIVSCNRDSSAYGVTSGGEVWAQVAATNTQPQRVSPQGERFARDVSVGADGTIWIVSTEAANGGHRAKYLDAATFLNPGEPEKKAVNFVDKPGTWRTLESRIAIDRVAGGRSGIAYGIGSDGMVWAFNKKSHRDPLSDERFATELSAGADGTLWVVSTERMPGGFRVKFQEPASHYDAGNLGELSRTWQAVRDPVAVTQLAAARDGNAYGVNDTGTVYVFDRSGAGRAISPANFAKRVTVGAYGIPWVIGSSSAHPRVQYYSAASDTWHEVKGFPEVVALAAR